MIQKQSQRRGSFPQRAAITAAAWGIGLMAGAGVLAQTPQAYQVEQGEIRAALADAGDPVRGRAVVLSRESGNCFLCHAFPDADGAPPGNLGPEMSGVGARMNAGQLRLRVVDSARVNAQSIMPAYYRIEGLNRVAAAYRGKPLLSAQQVEDVVAYLAQLK